MMKTRSQVMTEIERKLSRTWNQATSPGSSWLEAVSLGVPEKIETPGLAEHVRRECATWLSWADEHDVEVVTKPREVLGEAVRLPTRLLLADPMAAARVVGGSWPGRFATESWQRHVLEREFALPDDDAALAMRAVRSMDAHEFDLLVQTACWLRDNEHLRGTYSARQVPVPGIHAKWVQTRAPLLKLVLGVDDLGLVDTSYRQISFTYLDPDYRALPGARLHDSLVLGTQMNPQYLPEVVIVSENLDTAVLFPELKGAVSVIGQGSAGAEKMARVDWIARASRVLYWGDLDAQGFEILDRYRAHGLAVSSVLMDLDALYGYAAAASWRDTSGRPLQRQPRKDLKRLNKAERAAYLAVTDPEAGAETPVRIEQERIPLADALAAVQAVLKR